MAGARELINEEVILEGDYGDEGYRLTRNSSLVILPGGTGNPTYIHMTSGGGSQVDIDGLRMVGLTSNSPSLGALIHVGRENTVSIRNSWIESTDSIALRLGKDAATDADGAAPQAHVQNSTLKGVGRALLMQHKAQGVFEGVTAIGSHKADARINTGVQLMDTEVSFYDSYLKGSNNGVVIVGEASTGEQSHGRLYLSHTVVEGETGAAILVDDLERLGRIEATIVIANGSQLHGGNGKLIEAGYQTVHDDPITLDVTVDNSQLTGDFDFHERVVGDVTITNYGSLTGRLIGVNKLTLSDSGAWNLVEDSAIADLTMAGGIVDIHGTAADGAWHTLTVDKLAGEGTFALKTDLKVGTGDRLDINDTQASGAYQLLVANTGSEGGVKTQLLVDQAGGDATFSLIGDKVDAGVYSYTLQQSGEAGGEQSWYLERSGEVSNGTEAVLGIHNALPTAWLGEHSVLRARLGEVRLTEGDAGGAWARTFGAKFNARPALGRGYSQEQWGVIAGADGIVGKNAHGHWLVGGMAGTSTSRLDFNAGSRGTIESHTVGAYATWLGNNGYYVDGVLKYNRFGSELDVRMSDGVRSKADFVSHGVGLSAELGRTIALQHQWFVEPFAQVAGMWATGADFSLDNGMHAKSSSTKSLLGTVGVNVGKTFETSKGTFQPYVKLAVTHEFAKSNSVTINDINLASDISGTRLEAGAGVAAQMAKNLQVYIDGSYSVAKRLDKPWSANVGVRYRF